MNDENGSPKNICKFTPPTKTKVRNPFDRVLVEKLHKPICSPGMTKMYKKQANGSFKWEIDQACTLVPEDIVPCSSQFEPSPDPALEKIAEEANDKFFSQELLMPSPLTVSSKIAKPLLSNDISISSNNGMDTKVVTKDVSAQTVMTFPPELPPEVEKILEKFCTFTYDQNLLGEYEITANGSLRRKLFFEEHSDVEHYESDDETPIQIENRPPSSFESHTPVVFSPDLSRDLVAKGMKRTFGTPLKSGFCGGGKFRNKILDSVEFGEPCFSPIQFQTPCSRLLVTPSKNTTPSSLASTSISPVTKTASSDEEKNNFTSPESEAMTSCIDCSPPDAENDKKRPCMCKTPPEKALRRSASLKESPQRTRKGSISLLERRSLSMSSLHRNKSVQKLDFSMDMSVDGSMFDRSNGGDLDASPLPKEDPVSWSIVEESSIHQLVTGAFKNTSSEIQSSTKVHYDNTHLLDETPVKGKGRAVARTHEISKMRTPKVVSPLNMSLDTSLGSTDNLNLEHKKIDFNNVDLKFLTEHSHYDYANNTKIVSDSSNSFKRVDSGFNENTFYASSYYESAIKPSELTVTNASKTDCKNALKEISNVNWMRVDSGFKDETSVDDCQFYQPSGSAKNPTNHGFPDVKFDKENLMSGNFDRLIANKNEAMSMSEIFTEDLTFNCNFSSTPSKNKSRKVNT